MIDENAIVGAILGCGTSGFLAKWVIQRALADLLKLKDAVSEIRENMAEIVPELKRMEIHENLILENTKKIAYLEAICAKRRP